MGSQYAEAHMGMSGDHRSDLGRSGVWVLFGRPEGASMVPGGQIRYEDNPYRSEPDRYRSTPRVVGSEDSASWSRLVSARLWGGAFCPKSYAPVTE